MSIVHAASLVSVQNSSSSLVKYGVSWEYRLLGGVWPCAIDGSDSTAGLSVADPFVVDNLESVELELGEIVFTFPVRRPGAVID